MNIEELITHFQGVKANGNGGYTARCPAHDDKKPSLSINLGTKGIVLKCHANNGCTTKAIMEKIGRKESDLFNDKHENHLLKPPQADSSKKSFPTLEAVIEAYEKMNGWVNGWVNHEYLYEVPGQEIFFAVLRWDKADEKETRPASRDASGWHMEFPKGKRPLFNLPAVMEAVKKGEPIFVVEGEKCTIAAQSIGLVATTSAGGSQHGTKTDWKPLAGADICILPDNDKPGRGYAQEIANILHGLNPKTLIKIVELPELPPKGDLVEWLDTFGDAAEPEVIRDELFKLIEKTDAWEPRSGPNTEVELKLKEPVGEKPIPAGLVFRPISDLTLQFPNLREPIIDGLLRRGETMNIIASPKAGKSWLVTDLALSVAMGRPWLGHATKEGRVLIIDNELHPETTSYRIQKVLQAHGLWGNDVGDQVMIANSRGMLIDINSLGSQLTKFAPGQISLIVLDAFYRFMPPGTDENDNGGMTTIYNLIDSYAQLMGSSIVLIHHASKGNQSGKSITDVGSGAGSMGRAADSHLVLRAHNQEDVVVLDAKVRSFPPIQPFCLRKNHPLWEVDPLADPTDLKPEYSRKRPKRAEDETKTEPEKEHWDAGKFKIRFVTEQPVMGLKIVEDAVAAGLSRTRATALLKIAEGDKLIYRHNMGLNTSPFYATVPQRVEPANEPVIKEKTGGKKKKADDV